MPKLTPKVRVGSLPTKAEFQRGRGKKPVSKFRYGLPIREARALEWLYKNTGGDSWTDNTGWLTGNASDWAGVTVVNGHVRILNLLSWWDNNLNGDITRFPIDQFRWMREIVFGGNANLVGDISGWQIPRQMQSFNLYSTGVSGDISNLKIPRIAQFWALDNTSVTGDIAGLKIPDTLVQFAVNGTALTGVPDFSEAVALSQFRVHDMGLSQAEVDGYALALWQRRAAFTHATPDADMHGTNSTPSGLYVDADPPTAGKEYIYELENDPEIEGFNVWTIDYTP